MVKQAIVEVSTYGPAPDIGHSESKNINNSNIDLEQVFKIISDKFEYDVFYKSPMPNIRISAEDKVWVFELCDFSDNINNPSKGLYVRINAQNGEVIDFRDKGWVNQG